MMTKTKTAIALIATAPAAIVASPAFAQAAQEVNDLSGKSVTTGLFSAQNLMIAGLIALVAWRFLRRGISA